MKFIPINEVPDEQEFYQGTRIRRFGVGLTSANKSEDFFDYMLIDYDNEVYMLLANISTEKGSYLAGSVIAYVTKVQGVPRIVVAGKTLKAKLTDPETYLIIE